MRRIVTRIIEQPTTRAGRRRLVAPIARHLVAAACLVLAACSRQSAPQAPREGYAFPERFAAEPFESARWLAEEELLRLPFGGEAEPVSVVSRGVVRRPGRGYQLVERFGEVIADVATPVDATLVDFAEVTVRDLADATLVELIWAPVGEGVDRSRSILRTGRDSLGASRDRLRFELLSDPAWSGSIARVGVRVSGPRGEEPPVIAELSLHRARPSREALVASPDPQPVRIELDHEVRDAYLLSSSRPWRRRLAPLAGAELRFGAAALVRSGAVLSCSLKSLDGRGKVLHERSLELAAAELGVGVWREFRVAPLPAPEGSEVAIEFELSGPAGADGLVAVSSIEWSGQRPSPRPNLLLVSLDTLRSDRLSISGGGAPANPHLDSWVASGATVFERAYAPAASTLPSHASILTGRYPLRHGAYLESPLDSEEMTLAERLRGLGYRTLAATGGGFLHPHYQLDQGFERFRYWPYPTGSGKSDLAPTVDRALDWLDSASGRPFFLFLHTYETHGPYRTRPPQPPLRIEPKNRGRDDPNDLFERNRWPVVVENGVRRDLRRDEVGLARALYDQSVAVADAELGRLFAGLDRLGLAANTIVVVTADHGESLGEDSYWGHGYLWQTNLSVPLLVRWPPLTGEGRRVREPVSLVDLVPTLMEMLGNEVPAELDGESLVPLLRGGETNRPSRELWSYAPETNQGLALIRGDQKWIVRDVLVGRPADRAMRCTADDRVCIPVASPGEGVEAGLLARAEARLAAATSGWQFELENRGRCAASVALRSDRFQASNLKRLSGDPLSATFEPPHTLGIRLAPFATARFRAQLGDRNLALDSGIGGAAGRLETLNLEASCDEPLTKQLRGRGDLDACDVVVELTVKRRGPCGPAPTSNAPEELDEQLRSLGYLGGP